MDNVISISAEDQAAAWAARLDGGPLSRSEADALQAWIDAHPRNEALLESYQQLHVAVRERAPELTARGVINHDSELLPPRRPAWQRALLPLAAAAAVALAGVWFLNRPDEIVTDAAHRQSVALRDGSHVDINARTALEVSLRGSERHVTLTEGEAFFEVAKDPSRPFIVETPAGRVRVTGTRFNVRLDDPTSLEVTVLEGSVEVQATATEAQPGAAAAPARLAAGDQYAFNGARAQVRQLDLQAARDAVAWREGRIVFDGVPLRVAVDRFVRYHGREVEVAASVDMCRLGGRFSLDDLDGFLRDVEQAVPVKVLRGSNRVRIVPR